jgi:TetR/AcrR family transcriptional regulator, tetracycline repressor protein
MLCSPVRHLNGGQVNGVQVRVGPVRAQGESGRRNSRADVVEHALALLDDGGLPDLSMRRLAGELGVQPSALYHHFPNKQTLLAAVADELLTRLPAPTASAWEERLVESCGAIRAVLLSCRDGAELVATVWAFGLGARAPYDVLLASLKDGGLDALAPVAARTLLHFVYGHVVDEQTHLQAAEVGAIDDDARAGEQEADFEAGLGIVVAGIGLVRAVRE